MTNTKRLAAIAIGALLLGGWAYNNAGGRDYRGYEVRGEQSVRFGVVESVRDVKINPRESGVGTAGGATLGAIAGSNVGGGNGQIAGAIGGAILGGIIGQNVEKTANQRAGVEGTGVLDSGKYIPGGQETDESFPARARGGI